MAKLFGFTTILGDQHVIGLGRMCFVWSIYMAKVPRRRLKWCCFMINASHIVFHMKCNSGGKFRFFGYVNIDEDDLRDEYLKIEQERDELKERVAQLEPKTEPDRWWPDNVEVAPIEVITGHIKRRGYDPGYSVRLGNLFAANDIKKVGDLLRITRRQFKKYRSVGGGSLSRIDDALEELYNIKCW